MRTACLLAAGLLGVVSAAGAAAQLDLVYSVPLPDPHLGEPPSDDLFPFVTAVWTADDKILLSPSPPQGITPYVLNSGCSFIPLLNGTAAPDGEVAFEIPNVYLLDGMDRPYVFAPGPTILYREGYSTLEIWDPPEKCKFTYSVGSANPKVSSIVDMAVRQWTDANPIFTLAPALAGTASFTIVVPSDIAGDTAQVQSHVAAFLDDAIMELYAWADAAAKPPATDLVGDVSLVDAFTRDGLPYLAAAERDGPLVYVLNATVPAGSTLVATVPANATSLGNATASGMAAYGTTLLVAYAAADSVAIHDVADPLNVTTSYIMTGAGGGFEGIRSPGVIEVQAMGNSTYAFVSGGTNGSLAVIDVTDPGNPLPASYIPGNMREVNAVGFVDYDAKSFILVSTSGGLAVTDITDPSNPVPASSGIAPANATHMAVYAQNSSSYALAAVPGSGVHVLNVTDPRSVNSVTVIADTLPRLGATWSPNRLAVAGDVAVVLGASGGGQAIILKNVSSPEPLPEITDLINFMSPVRDVALFVDPAGDDYMVSVLETGLSIDMVPISDYMYLGHSKSNDTVEFVNPDGDASSENDLTPVNP